MLRALRHAGRVANRGRGQRAVGFTLVELAFAMGLFLLMLAATVAFVVPAVHGSNVAQALVTNEQTVTLAMVQMEKDIRAANPLDVFDSSVCSTYTNATYNDQIQVQIGPSGGTQQTVRWVYSSTADTLTRQVISGTGCSPTIVRTTDVVSNVLNGSTPVFTYFDDTGTNLINSGSPDNIGNCAVQVGIEVIGRASTTAGPFTEQVNVQLRDRLPGGMPGCA